MTLKKINGFVTSQWFRGSCFLWKYFKKLYGFYKCRRRLYLLF